MPAYLQTDDLLLRSSGWLALWEPATSLIGVLTMHSSKMACVLSSIALLDWGGGRKQPVID